MIKRIEVPLGRAWVTAVRTASSYQRFPKPKTALSVGITSRRALPASQRHTGSILTAIVTQSCLLELMFQRGVFTQRDDLDNHVDVASSAHGRGGRLGNKEAGDAAAHENESRTQRS